MGTGGLWGAKQKYSMKTGTDMPIQSLSIEILRRDPARTNSRNKSFTCHFLKKSRPGPDPAATLTQTIHRSLTCRWGGGEWYWPNFGAPRWGAHSPPPPPSFFSKIFKWSIWPYMGALWARSAPKTRFWVISDRFWAISERLEGYFRKNNSARPEPNFLALPFHNFFLTAPFFNPSWGGGKSPPLRCMTQTKFQKTNKRPLLDYAIPGEDLCETVFRANRAKICGTDGHVVTPRKNKPRDTTPFTAWKWVQWCSLGGGGTRVCRSPANFGPVCGIPLDQIENRIPIGCIDRSKWWLHHHVTTPQNVPKTVSTIANKFHHKSFTKIQCGCNINPSELCPFNAVGI